MRAAETSFSLTRWQHSTLLREITSWPPFWKYDVRSKIWRHILKMAPIMSRDSGGQYCDLVYVTWRDFDQSHARISRWGLTISKLTYLFQYSARRGQSHIKSKVWLCHLMRICVKNILAKFHPDPFWNDRGLGYFEEVAQTRRSTTRRTTSTKRCIAKWDQFLMEILIAVSDWLWCDWTYEQVLLLLLSKLCWASSPAPPGGRRCPSDACRALTIGWAQRFDGLSQ